MACDAQRRNSHQYVVLEVDEHAAGLSRDLLLQILRAENGSRTTTSPAARP